MGTVFGIEMRHKKAVDGNNANCFVRNVAVASGLVSHSQTINSYLFLVGRRTILIYSLVSRTP